jgi:hypothetical protein
MPFTIKKNPEGKFCVYKADADGKPAGKTLGCHTKKSGAVEQIGAVEESLSEQGKKSLPSINFYMVPQELPEVGSITYGNSGNYVWYELDDSGTAVTKNKGDSPEEWNNDMTKSAEDTIDKAVTITGSIDAYRTSVWQAWEAEYSKDFDSWVTEIFDDYVIVYYLRENFKVPYSVSGEEVVFADKQEWSTVKLKSEWVDKSAAISQRMTADWLLDTSEEADGAPEITDTGGAEEIMSNTAPDPRYALKALGKNRVGTYGILWGDEERKDLHDEFFDEETRDLKAIFDAMGVIPLIVHHGGDEAIKTFVYGEVDVMELDDVGLWYEGKIKEFEVYYNYVKPLMDENKMFSSSGTLPAAKRVAKNGHITRWPVAEMTNTWLPAEYRMLERPLAEIKSAYNELGLELPDLDKKEPEKAKESNEVQDKNNAKGAEKARLEALIEQELQKLNLSEIAI